MKINEFSSFKDPSGFIFIYGGKILRQINLVYKDNYQLLMQSGLYKKLTEAGFLIPHQESDFSFAQSKEAYKVIEPQSVPFISYPYEWSFSQLKDAALLTLAIQKEALNFGMSLKDANGFNIQFISGKPILIDTLSFEKYEEGKPWVAYKQFSENFLAPLALVVYNDWRLQKLLADYIEGIPLDLAAKLLPWSAKIKPSLFFHIFLHARNQKRFADVPLRQNKSRFSKQAFLGLIESLEKSIKSLDWKIPKTAWSDYYKDNACESYENAALSEKKNIVTKYLEIIRPKTLWDIGANAGMFSKIAAEKNIFVVSMDNDPAAVEQNYRRIKKEKEENILPLLIDIGNPTAGVGWYNQERLSIFSRPHPQAILALALIHHLAIGKNLPFSKIASFFAEICQRLIIEFIPKEDKQTQRLLRSREDIFENYNQTSFESEFGKFFDIKEKTGLKDSKRTIYLMTCRKKYENNQK